MDEEKKLKVFNQSINQTDEEYNEKRDDARW